MPAYRAKPSRTAGMTPRAAITQLAKAAGHALAIGDPSASDGIHAAAAMLAEAGATPAILHCLLDETRRKRPSDTVIEGCAFLLQTALDSLRLASSGGEATAARAIEEVGEAVRDALATGALDPAVLLLVGRAFAQAGLDPGMALQQALGEAMEGAAPAGLPGTSPADFAAMFDDIAAQLEHDPFAIHAELAASGAALPAEHRAAMAEALAASGSEAARQAALGFAFAANPRVAAAALTALAEAPGDRPVPNATVTRLARMRPWLSAARQPPVDAALRALRPRAAPADPAAAPPQIRRVLASLCDGVGAQSLFALTAQGRRFAMASVLVKQEVGVADAWVRGDMSQREADAMVREIVGAAEAVDISLTLLQRRLGDALAINLARDAPPPFALLQVAEVLGLGALPPRAEPARVLADALLAGLPPGRTGEAAEQAAQLAAAGWERRFATLESWFEGGETVETVLRSRRTRKQRIEAVLADVLPPRREVWAERCAWMAATLRETAAHPDEVWSEFALVARAFAGDRPLQAMPAAHAIAAATVDVFARR